MTEIPARENSGAARRALTRLLQSLLTCPRFELVTLTNIIQSLDILREQSARFINPANFGSAEAVFEFLVTIMHYRCISPICLCWGDVQQSSLPRTDGTGAQGWASPAALGAHNKPYSAHRHRSQHWYSSLTQSSRDPHNQIHFWKMTRLHLLVLGLN